VEEETKNKINTWADGRKDRYDNDGDDDPPSRTAHCLINQLAGSNMIFSPGSFFLFVSLSFSLRHSKACLSGKAEEMEQI